jgi:hypothetical protein
MKLAVGFNHDVGFFDIYPIKSKGARSCGRFSLGYNRNLAVYHLKAAGPLPTITRPGSNILPALLKPSVQPFVSGQGPTSFCAWLNDRMKKKWSECLAERQYQPSKPFNALSTYNTRIERIKAKSERGSHKKAMPSQMLEVDYFLHAFLPATGPVSPMCARQVERLHSRCCRPKA